MLQRELAPTADTVSYPDPEIGLERETDVFPYRQIVELDDFYRPTAEGAAPSIEWVPFEAIRAQREADIAAIRARSAEVRNLRAKTTRELAETTRLKGTGDTIEFSTAIMPAIGSEEVRGRAAVEARHRKSGDRKLVGASAVLLVVAAGAVASTALRGVNFDRDQGSSTQAKMPHAPGFGRDEFPIPTSSSNRSAPSHSSTNTHAPTSKSSTTSSHGRVTTTMSPSTLPDMSSLLPSHTPSPSAIESTSTRPPTPPSLSPTSKKSTSPSAPETTSKPSPTTPSSAPSAPTPTTPPVSSSSH